VLEVVYHCNPHQPHQVEHGHWLKAGLWRHGLELKITADCRRPADVHIVSGPHYAKGYWLDHPRTLLLDRAYYHEVKSGRWKSMDWVSLGWMLPDGGRRFSKGEGRPAPERKPIKTEGGRIFLADYNGTVLNDVDTVRLHPANRHYDEPLLDVLARHRHAIGYMTTALVTAALEGLTIDCRDRRNILAEPDWIQLLPYADWHGDEISAGDAWEHLVHDIDTGYSTRS